MVKPNPFFTARFYLSSTKLFYWTNFDLFYVYLNYPFVSFAWTWKISWIDNRMPSFYNTFHFRHSNSQVGGRQFLHGFHFNFLYWKSSVKTSGLRTWILVSIYLPSIKKEENKRQWRANCNKIKVLNLSVCDVDERMKSIWHLQKQGNMCDQTFFYEAYPW